MILPQTGRYLIVIPDGLGTLTPQSASIEFYWATDVTFKFAVVHSDGTAYDLTSTTLQLTFKNRETDTSPLVSRQADVTSASSGLAEAYITSANDRTLLIPGSYAVDVVFTDSSGPTAIRDEGLLPSRALVKGTVTQVGDPVTVPAFQQPLAQGPAGTDGTNGTNGTNGTDGATGATGADGTPGPAGLSYATFALFRAGTPPANNTLIPIAGHSAAGDGGGGLFLYSSASTATDDDALTLKPTSVGAGAGRALRQYDAGIYNVKWFGAKGDNSTDDTAAIQATIDFVAGLATSGGIVFFPKGLYKIASQLSCLESQGVRLVGVGFETTGNVLTSSWSPSSLMFSSDGTGLPVNSLGYKALIDARSTLNFELSNLGVFQTNPGFTDLIVDFGHSASGSDSGFARISRCGIGSIYFDGAHYTITARAGISFSGAIECTVEKCNFFRTLAGIRGQEAVGNSIAYSNVIKVRDCQFSTTTRAIVNPGQSWEIKSNTCEGLQGLSNDYLRSFVFDDIDDTTNGYSHDLLTIEDNWCGDAFGQQEWIKLRPISNSRICHNLLEGSSQGCIQFFSSYSNPVCTSNTIKDNDYSPTSGFILDFGSNITWIGLETGVFDQASGNILNLPKRYGSEVKGLTIAGAAKRPSIEGNSFSPAIAPNEMPVSGGGLLAWWKADALSLNDGDLVSTWADSSGHGWDLTASGSQRPTFKTSIQAGLPVVRFDGVANKMVTADMGFTTACTFLLVFRANGSLVSQDTVIDGSLGANQARCYRSGIYEMNLGGLTLGISPTRFGAHAVVATGQSDGSSSARGGDLVAQGNLANFTINIHSVVLGMDGAGLHPMAMDLAEVAIFDRYLYPDEAVGALEAQRTKWQCM